MKARGGIMNSAIKDTLNIKLCKLFFFCIKGTSFIVLPYRGARYKVSKPKTRASGMIPKRMNETALFKAILRNNIK
jgi:hypothetical protein